MLDLWIFILHFLKLHRKTILQQTPSSDTLTSGTPISIVFFFLLGMAVTLEEKKKVKDEERQHYQVDNAIESGLVLLLHYRHFVANRTEF